jgi:hypothetical protein
MVMTSAGAGLLVEILITSRQAPLLADAFDGVLESLTARRNAKPQESGQRWWQKIERILPV